MGVDIHIDAAGECLKQAPLVCRHGGGQVFRRGTYLKHALCFVVLHYARTEQFGQLPGGEPSRHIHLPQPVLGQHVALGLQQVLHVGCLDVGDAVGVAPYQHRGGEPGHLNLAVDHRQLLPHGVFQPGGAPGDSYDGCDEQPGEQSSSNPHQ